MAKEILKEEVLSDEELDEPIALFDNTPEKLAVAGWNKVGIKFQSITGGNVYKLDGK